MKEGLGWGILISFFLSSSLYALPKHGACGNGIRKSLEGSKYFDDTAINFRVAHGQVYGYGFPKKYGNVFEPAEARAIYDALISREDPKKKSRDVFVSFGGKDAESRKETLREELREEGKGALSEESITKIVNFSEDYIAVLEKKLAPHNLRLQSYGNYCAVRAANPSLGVTIESRGHTHAGITLTAAEIGEGSWVDPKFGMFEDGVRTPNKDASDLQKIPTKPDELAIFTSEWHGSPQVDGPRLLIIMNYYVEPIR